MVCHVIILLGLYNLPTQNNKQEVTLSGCFKIAVVNSKGFITK